MGSKFHKKKKLNTIKEIKYENKIPTTCKLIGNRIITKKQKMYGIINYIYPSKIDNKEIILILYGYGIYASGELEIFDSKTFEILSEKGFSSKLYDGADHKIIEIKNGEFLISSNEKIQKFTLIKDNITNKIKITNIKNFLFNYAQNNWISQMIKLENENIVILNKTHYLKLISLNKSNSEKKNTHRETTIDLPDPSIEHYDIISMNNDIIVFINRIYLNIFSLENKQIVTRFELIISESTDDIVRKISDDMIFFAGINNLYFISITKGIIVKHIKIPNIYCIFGLGDLSDNNLLCAAMKFDKHYFTFDFFQFKYIFEENDEKKEKELKVDINSVYKFHESVDEIVYIKELEDKRIILGTEEKIYFFE